jgi:hypothetical protein
MNHFCINIEQETLKNKDFRRRAKMTELVNRGERNFKESKFEETLKKFLIIVNNVKIIIFKYYNEFFKNKNSLQNTKKMDIYRSRLPIFNMSRLVDKFLFFFD